MFALCRSDIEQEERVSLNLDFGNYMNKHDEFWEKFYSTHRSTVSRYLLPIILSILSLIIIKLIFLSCGGPPLTSLALLSVIISCIYGGKGSAVVCTLMTAIGIELVFISSNSFYLHWGHSVIRVIVYGVVAVIVCGLVDSLKNNLVTCRLQKNLVISEIKEKEEILSVVSNDLKVPLSSVIMSASLFNREADSKNLPDNSAKLISVILNSANRMNSLIEDLLDSVKFDSGSFSLNLRSYNFIEVVSSSVDESQLIANKKRIEIIFENSKDALEVQCDPERCIQVISNIISNAVKFSPENSRITIKLTEMLKEVVVSIKDEGCGISAEDIPKLFSKFWQVKGTAHLGTGLGLFIAHKIIYMHKGHIEVESICGKGSNFKIYLPRV